MPVPTMTGTGIAEKPNKRILNMPTIIGIKINNRIQSAIAVQEILTKYGCIIKTRIGLHDEINGQCSPKGLIILEIVNDKAATEIANELCDIEEIEIQQMKFT